MNRPFRKSTWPMLLFIIVIYYSVIHLSRSSTSCVYQNIFGIPCPGCGMTRSYKAFLHADFEQAFYYHPLFLLVPIVIILVGYQFYLIKKKRRHSGWIEGILFVIVILFIAVYVYRMILYFPHTEPMDFYEKGLIPRVISESLR